MDVGGLQTVPDTDEPTVTQYYSGDGEGSPIDPHVTYSESQESTYCDNVLFQDWDYDDYAENSNPNYFSYAYFKEDSCESIGAGDWAAACYASCSQLAIDGINQAIPNAVITGDGINDWNSAKTLYCTVHLKPYHGPSDEKPADYEDNPANYDSPLCIIPQETGVCEPQAEGTISP
jgi:hypothetical protein